MVRKEILNIYKFEELNKEAQEKAIENQRKNQNEFGIDLDWWNENLQDDLTSKGFYDIELRYSLSYSQGDGLSFRAKLNIMDFLKINKIKTRFKKLHTAIEENDIYLEMNLNQFGTHYMHSNTINLDLSSYIDLTKKQSQLMEELEEIIQEYYNDFCNKSENEGYTIIENEQSDDYLKELIEMNEYEFTANGEMW